MTAFQVINRDFIKLDWFDGTSFTGWQDKMMFLLIALKVQYVLDPNLPPLPKITDNNSDETKAIGMITELHMATLNQNSDLWVPDPKRTKLGPRALKSVFLGYVDAYGVIICLYVDDLLIFSTNLEEISETKKHLNSRFKMKGLNEVDTAIGIKVKKHSGGYALSQSHYIEKMLLN
ncbi:hypothetical protein RJ639_038547 [Escallonia herrerae]|uniref:Reverse transcriptase Ty1/copia-type domain-containing protein n=1 Tax=Escallonia herrerae TaxID=1293975 RepID=A0AA89B925_9ASTE|nr:hypothetical protein RJ639_038547 [Escallonia herrerae]